MLKPLCSLAALAVVAAAQSPLTTVFGSDNGGAPGWTVYFDVTVHVPVTISRFDVNTGSVGVPGGLSVHFTTTAATYVGNDTQAGAWTLGGVGSCTGAALDAPTVCNISPFLLLPGSYGMAVVHNGIAPSYTNGNGTAVPGSGTNQTYSNAELTLRAGASAAGGLGTAICCAPRVFNCNLHYTVGGAGTATSTTYGSGCYPRHATLYESFPASAAFDLANTSLTMVLSGSGYTVLPGVGTFIPPSGAATALTMANDSETGVALSSPFPHSTGMTSNLTVCSNGFVSIAAGNGVAGTPDVAMMRNAPQTAWWNHHDYDPSIAGSGLVKFEEVGSLAIVTWDGVWNGGGTSAAAANTFQFQFDTASGAVHLVFGAMSLSGNGRLVAYSPGGASSDPGNTDLSVTLPGTITLPAADTSGLALVASARPLLNTTISLDTSNVTGSSLGVVFLSPAQIPAPGFDLGVIGAGGCVVLVDINLGIGYVINNLWPGGLSVPLSVPNDPLLLGVVLYGQSVWLDASANAFGALTSNAIALVLGNQ